MRKPAEPAANLLCENQIREQGFERIVGIDEAGRGTWAGPVTAAAVSLPLHQRKLSAFLAGVRDSKVMTRRERESIVETIKDTAVAWGIGSANNQEIDAVGIVAGTKLAMTRALESLGGQFPDFQPQCLFLDGMVWAEKVGEIPQVSLIDGDARSLSIAAASVLAKVARDATMVELDRAFPEYGFAVHKGYGTRQHLAALQAHGPCALHRLTFKPVQQVIQSRI